MNITFIIECLQELTKGVKIIWKRTGQDSFETNLGDTLIVQVSSTNVFRGPIFRRDSYCFNIARKDADGKLVSLAGLSYKITGSILGDSWFVPGYASYVEVLLRLVRAASSDNEEQNEILVQLSTPKKGAAGFDGEALEKFITE